MKILLIGATGQIGYALAMRLTKRDCLLRVLVRNKQKLPFPAPVEIVAFQQFTVDAFKSALKGVDLVIYAAGLPEQFTLARDTFERINYGVLARFLMALEQAEVRRLVYISTYEVFASLNNRILESHPIADPAEMTPYFQSMIKAYRLLKRYASDHDLALTTIHPAAVYGGINTGEGFTSYIEKLIKRQRLRIPMIINGRFPLVHADSLADAIIRSFGHCGAFIVSDQITSLREIAVTLSQLTCQRSIVPPTMPLWLARSNTVLLELFGHTFKVRALISRVQIEFITNGPEPINDKVQQELKWSPMPLSEGLKNYLRDRENIPLVDDKIH